MTDDAREVPDEDVYAAREEGRSYYGSSYVPTAHDNFDLAPETDAYPDRGRPDERVEVDAGFRVLDLPRVPKLSHVVGPSAILLVGGFVSLGWPGWAASAARIGSICVGIEAETVGVAGVTLATWKAAGIGLLVLIWLSYQVTPVMYNGVERVQVLLVSVSVVVAVVLFFLTGSAGELAAVPGAVVDSGTLPPRSDVALVLGGIAFAGAGGYLNLSKSLWVREKGYGMGRHRPSSAPAVSPHGPPRSRSALSVPVRPTIRISCLTGSGMSRM
jgi:hypothetical protein